MLRKIEASARLQGTREELTSILIDFGRYSEWVPGIDRSEVLAREGDVTVAEFQSRQFGKRTCNLELILSLPESIVFRQIDSLGRAQISGQCRIGETENESSSPRTPIRLFARVETPLLDLGSGQRVRAALLAGLDALGARSRPAESKRPDTIARRRKVLEVVRTSGGLRVWYQGESFVLPKEDAPS